MAIEKFQLTRSVGSVTRVPPHMVADLDISTHTFRGERDIFKTFTDCSIRVFQLTRSVGSVTDFTIKWVLHRHNFNSHAPWGAWRDLQLVHYYVQNFNSHAPWGAWPIADITRTPLSLFQLTRSVGSVTTDFWRIHRIRKISTHTLRGERDGGAGSTTAENENFNSHAPWGAWHSVIFGFYGNYRFQLTRSVGSVTK